MSEVNQRARIEYLQGLVVEYRERAEKAERFMIGVDYAEILRLYRKYRARDDEPFWVTFVMIGQRLERAKSERCKACHRTALEYSRLIDVTCDNPWHLGSVGPSQEPQETTVEADHG